MLNLKDAMKSLASSTLNMCQMNQAPDARIALNFNQQDKLVSKIYRMSNTRTVSYTNNKSCALFRENRSGDQSAYCCHYGCTEDVF